jgi:hypothetical protein
MSHVEPERDRLVKLVDGLIEAIEDDHSESEAPRIATAAIVAIVEYDNEDGETFGVPVWFAESSRPWQHMALFQMALQRMNVTAVANQVVAMLDDDDE